MSKFTHRENCIRAAAAIDCNGTISLRDGYYIICRIDTVKDDYQRWLLKEFGGKLGTYARNKNKKSKWNQRPERITWVVYQEDAVDFLGQIAPFLLTKKEQAELMVELGKEQEAVGSSLSVAEKQELWSEYAKKMKMLNKI